MRILVPDAAIPPYLRAAGAGAPFESQDGARERIRERHLRPQPFGPPGRMRGVRISRRLPDPGGWPVYDVEPTRRRGSDPSGLPVVVYVHGGGWVDEIRPQHWQLIARIARETRQRVVVPIHPLLPRGRARQVRDGVVELVHQELAAGRQVRAAGDSSGGQIVLSALLALRDQGIALPAAALLSPALDLTWQNPRIPELEPIDPWLSVPGAEVLSAQWAGDDELTDPAVSPLSGDLRGLGPLTVLTGTRDVLNPDARLLRDRARAVGVELAWHEAEDQLHVFPLLPTRAGERGARIVVESLRPAPGPTRTEAGA